MQAAAMDAEAPFLQKSDSIVGAVDYLGRPVFKSSSGRWSSAAFMIGVEAMERFAFFGATANLMSYLTGPLRQSTASAAASINAWSGAVSMLPLLGAFLADSYLGRYITVLLASVIYILALGMLTISTVLPTLRPLDCTGDAHVASIDHCTPTSSQVAFFYSSLYLLAFAQGGHKPCAQAFGADQFDHTDPQDLRSRSSFFNWWNFSTCCGALLANILLSYIQDYISWTLGFAIPCFALLFALCLFLLGSKTYRFYPVQDDNPFARAAKTLHMAVTSIGRRTQSITSSKEEEEEGSRGHQANISLPSKLEGNCIDHNEEKSKEANCSLLKLFPIWVSCLVYGVVYSQPGTLFIKQGSTMDRRIGSSIQVPPAALQSLLSVSLIVLIPIYDHILVPVARSYSKLPSGITMLQRIGAGIALSMLAMVTAALVEMKRLHMARELGLVEIDHAMIPMSLWWLAPQYFFMGASMVFVLSGMQEFFYDQVPDALRSLGLALYLSVLGVGAFISSVLVFLIDLVTSSRSGGESWFSNNLNKGHLDYFYWLLAGLSVWGFLVYIYFAQSYCYRRSHK